MQGAGAGLTLVQIAHDAMDASEAQKNPNATMNSAAVPQTC